MPITVNCLHCGRPAELVDGEVIYPHLPDLHDRRYWLCEPCDAWVGCHGTGCRPLGLPADLETRRARVETHRMFDRLWFRKRHRDKDARTRAYQWLAEQMGLSRSECHIGKFDLDQCLTAQRAVRAKMGGA